MPGFQLPPPLVDVLWFDWGRRSGEPLWGVIVLGGVVFEDFRVDDRVERVTLADRFLNVFLGEDGMLEGVTGDGSFLETPGERLVADKDRSLPLLLFIVLEAALAARERTCLCSGTFSFVVVAALLDGDGSLLPRVGERQRGELRFDSLNLEFLFGDTRPGFSLFTACN